MGDASRWLPGHTNESLCVIEYGVTPSETPAWEVPSVPPGGVRGGRESLRVPCRSERVGPRWDVGEVSWVDAGEKTSAATPLAVFHCRNATLEGTGLYAGEGFEPFTGKGAW
jgi:hypothetical protein